MNRVCKLIVLLFLGIYHTPSIAGRMALSVPYRLRTENYAGTPLNANGFYIRIWVDLVNLSSINQTATVNIINIDSVYEIQRNAADWDFNTKMPFASWSQNSLIKSFYSKHVTRTETDSDFPNTLLVKTITIAPNSAALVGMTYDCYITDDMKQCNDEYTISSNPKLPPFNTLISTIQTVSLTPKISIKEDRGAVIASGTIQVFDGFPQKSLTLQREFNGGRPF